MVFIESFDESINKLSNANSLGEEVVESIAKKINRTTIKYWMDYHAEDVINKILKNTPPDDIVASIKNEGNSFTKFAKYSTEDIGFKDFFTKKQTFTESPPSIEVERRINFSEAKDLLDKYNSVTGKNSSSRTFEAFVEYDYFFPSPKTPPSSSGGGAAIMIPLDARNNNTIDPRNYKQSHSFNRVGGVLIGRSPDESSNDESPNIVDITWKYSGNNVEISLVNKEKEEIRLGIFDKEIINRALAYSADGRLVAVTILNSDLVAHQKVLLHPTLVNNKVGQNTILLDKLVFDYDKYDKNVANAIEMLSYQKLLFVYSVFFMDNRKLLDNVEDSNNDQIKGIFSLASSMINSKWNILYKQSENGVVYSDPQKFFVHNMHMPGASNLSRDIAQSLSECNGSIKSFQESLSQIPLTEDVFKVAINLFFSVINSEDASLVSGVREVPYKLDKKLSCITGEGALNSYLYPFSFNIQIAFSKSGDEIREPWEFPYLKNQNTVDQMVQYGLKKNPRDYSMFMYMKSFAIAQRLFKLAFEGKLGNDFPVHKLYDLYNTCSGQVPMLETPMWHISPESAKRQSEEMSKMNPTQKQIYRDLLKHLYLE